MFRISRLLSTVALASSMMLTAARGQDAPKPADAPKADAPKADAPAPAADAPKPDAAKPDAAKPDAAKPDAAKPDAPATPPATAPSDTPAPLPEVPQNQSLHDDVDDFWHYGKIARYDMTTAFGNKILTRTEPPVEILGMFEKVAVAHQDSLDDWIIRWSTIDASGLKGTALKIDDLLKKGRYERRKDPKWIDENIQGLAVNERAYRNHLANLRMSGELVVSPMLDYLRDKDAAKAVFKDPIRRALVDLGRPILNPLIAATETKDEDLQLNLINILARIGYDVAAPYLARIAEDRTHPGLASAANSALSRIGAANRGNVADQFYRLGEHFYYNNASIQVDPKAPVAYMWYWGDTGLTYKEVPPQIFADLMAEREAEYALQLGHGKADALSLWLVANNKLELDLPEGASTGVFDKDRPTAHYYNCYAGSQYLNAGLTRSLEDHNSQVAIKLIKSLAEIVGPSSQGSGVRLDPLVAATRYADRLVRFEAAFALASGKPNSPFPGHERVAPLLAEAISQTGTANVLIIAPSQGDENKYRTDLKDYGIASGADPQLAFTNALKLPAIDVIVFPESLGNAQIDRIYQLAADNPRLERAAKLIITTSKMSPWAQRVIGDQLSMVTTATDGPGLAAAVEEARKRAGGLPLDEKVATAYAVKAANTLQTLAAGRVGAYDLSVVMPTLLASLNDKRPEVVKAVGEVLAYMNFDQTQPSIMAIASAEKTPDDVRISLLGSLGKNSRFFGNHLTPLLLDDLQKLVDANPNLDVRTAAASARGSLNLAADQAKELIVKQAKH